MNIIGLAILSYLRANWGAILAALVAASIATGWSVHERHVQAAKDAAKIASLRADLLTASHKLSDAAASFRQIAAIEQANKAAADAQAAAGKAALDKLKAEDAKRATALSDALRKQRKAYQGDACASQPLPQGVQ